MLVLHIATNLGDVGELDPTTAVLILVSAYLSKGTVRTDGTEQLISIVLTMGTYVHRGWNFLRCCFGTAVQHITGAHIPAMYTH
jgi:hypothetical protein